MTRTTIFLPKPFPATKERSQPYRLIGPEALEGTGVGLETVRGIAAAGHLPITKDLIARFPRLEIISRFGVGYDNVDVEAARAAGIVVTNTPDVLTDEVADLALGLLIATVRQIPQADRFLRAGHWKASAFGLSGSLRGRRVGILGLGRIGRAIAERVSAMRLEVAYCTRRQQADAPYAYYADPLELARGCDVLIVAVPGGASTDRLISRGVIEALGPEGVLINVARGTVVDEPALVEALQTGKLGAAGLDVFVDEPNVPDSLLGLNNVVLLPHVGSATTITRVAMGDHVFANLDSWFAGNGPLTPVP